MDRFDLVLWDLRNHGWNPVGERRRHNMPTFASDSRTIAEATDIHFGAKPRHWRFPLCGGHRGLTASDRGRRRLCRPGLAGPADMPSWENGGGAVGDWRCDGGADAPTQKVIRQLAGIHRVRRALPDVSAHSKRDAGSVGPNHAARVAVGEDMSCAVRRNTRPRSTNIASVGQCKSISDLEGRDDFCPIKAIGSDPTVPYSFMPAMDLGTWVKLSYDFIPESTHFLPLEHPEEWRRIDRGVFGRTRPRVSRRAATTRSWVSL